MSSSVLITHFFNLLFLASVVSEAKRYLSVLTMPDKPLYLREYLTRYLHSHSGCAKGLLNKGDTLDLEIILIDVKERRLVKMPPRIVPKYIILSYV